MQHDIARALAMALALGAGLSLAPGALAQVPTTQFQTQAPSAAALRAPPATPITLVDPVKQRIDALEKKVLQLEQANAALTSRVQLLDEGLGKVVLVNISQSTQIKDTNTKIDDTNSKIADTDGRVTALTTKFNTHTHKYSAFNIAYGNQKFVTAAHYNGDETATASRIDGTVHPVETTSPPNP